MIIEADSIARMSRILGGAGPIEQCSIFELVTNLRTAKALDLAPTLLGRANSVFE